MAASLYSKSQIPNKGNGLVAICQIPAGTTILSVPDPFTAILQNDSLDDYCYYCFLSSSQSELKSCAGCHSVSYCGKPCQSKSWKRDHKQDCRIWKEVKSQDGRILPTQTRALICMLIRYRVVAYAGKELEGLESHGADIMSGGQSQENVQLQVRMVSQLLSLSTTEQELAQRLCCILQVNAFQLIDHSENEIGLLFDPLASLANHSCVPNAFISVDGRKASLKALYPIEKDVEITISYTESTAPLATRQYLLSNKYHFKCTCVRCTGNMTPHEVFTKMLAPKLCTIPDLAQGSLYRQDYLLTNPPELNADKVQKAYTQALTDKDWSLAASLLVHKICHLDPILYPSPIHPNRVTSILALARLVPSALETGKSVVMMTLLEQHELEIQMSLLLLARHNGLIAFGEGSRFVVEAEQELGGVVGEMKRRSEVEGMRPSRHALNLLEFGLAGPGLDGDNGARALWEMLPIMGTKAVMGGVAEGLTA